jgi:hypothetical protein
LRTWGTGGGDRLVDQLAVLIRINVAVENAFGGRDDKGVEPGDELLAGSAALSGDLGPRSLDQAFILPLSTGSALF